MKLKERSRTRIISATIVLVSLVLIARLYFVQVMNGQNYSDKANGQYIHPTETVFDRGSIFFTTKDEKPLAAATVKTGYFLYLTPKTLGNPESAYSKISKIAPIDKTSFLARATKKNDPYEEIVHRLDEKTADAITALKIQGVFLHEEHWRYYPGDHLAASTVGLMGFKGDDFAGRYGLEKAYDENLSRDSSALYSNFFAEIFNGVTSVFKDQKQEGDIVTTIEPNVERFLEGELTKIDETWHPTETGAIILDPATGEVRAMALHPTFDPNSPQVEKSSVVFSNPLVENSYEMGSILKPLTMAAGIDAGVVTPSTTYNDKGTITIDSRKISNYDGKARGVVSMQEVLNQSLNMGAVFVMQKLGRGLFSSYFRSFGLGDKTGIDLPNESPGLIANLESTRDVEHATASFGQGIAMSPMSITRALSTLANGGLLVTPHVVKTINYRIGVSKSITEPPPKQVLKKETTDEITKMLVTVVDKALVNGAVSMPHYSIAAKTGTAQIANPAGGGYYEDRYLHSFFGYFPAYNPKFLIFFYQIYPKGAQYASATLTNPFIDTAKFLINYYEIPPDR